MKRPKQPPVSSRKQPRQDRSKQMVADILEASIRVLRREGALRFNTIRVAQAAGVSVGSLYQYFPNKAALLWRLQVDEWDSTLRLLATHLTNRSLTPAARWRLTVTEFFRTELEEADLRQALLDASALFRDSPEARRQEARARSLVRGFFREALPARSDAEVDFASEFFFVALGSIAEKVTSRTLSARELSRWSTATAEMSGAYLQWLQAPR